MIGILKPFFIIVKMGASKGLESVKECPLGGWLVDKIEPKLANSSVSGVNWGWRWGFVGTKQQDKPHLEIR